MGDDRNVYKVLTSKCARKILLGMAKHRWEENIRMVLKK